MLIRNSMQAKHAKYSTRDRLLVLEKVQAAQSIEQAAEAVALKATINLRLLP